MSKQASRCPLAKRSKLFHLECCHNSFLKNSHPPNGCTVTGECDQRSTWVEIINIHELSQIFFLFLEDEYWVGQGLRPKGSEHHAKSPRGFPMERTMEVVFWTWLLVLYMHSPQIKGWRMGTFCQKSSP